VVVERRHHSNKLVAIRTRAQRIPDLTEYRPPEILSGMGVCLANQLLYCHGYILRTYHTTLVQCGRVTATST